MPDPIPSPLRFRALDLMLVRVPTLPSDLPPPPDRAGLDDRSALVDRLRALARDPLLREAVEVASRSLADAWSRATDQSGAPPPTAELWRIAMSVTGYHLRAAARATPFGLLAGVATARLADQARVRLGDRHRTVSRPDREWLRHALRRMERELLPALRLTADDAYSVIGDRVVLIGSGELAETSVRRTPVVAAVLAAAAHPVHCRHLVDRVATAFPVVPRERLTDLIARLVELRFLLTDLEPTSACQDPMEHVVGRADRVPTTQWAGVFADIKGRLDAYDRQPPGTGSTLLRQASEPMLALHQTDTPIQVDLAIDATIELPREVAQEAARAADALWRISPSRPWRPLAAYHRRFLDRYGTERLVPVLELLSPDHGLGPPSRGRPEPAPDPHPARCALLARLVTDAARQRNREVVLTEDDVATLADDTWGAAPASLELYGRLMAPTADALSAGDFRLVVAPDLGTHPVGTAFARFTHLFPDNVRTEIEEVVRAASDGRTDATVEYRPLAGRAANVAAAPSWLCRRIPVSVPTAPRRPGELPLRRLAVGATAASLFLVSLSDGRAVRPVIFDLLRADGVLPAVVRFLRDLGDDGVRAMLPWSWGPTRHAPFLPRVRLGRAILSSASWNTAGTALVSAAHAEPGRWTEAVRRWQAEEGIPDRVLLADRDRRIPLCLDDEIHLRILRRQVRRAPPVITELPGGEDYRDGWLLGHRGPHLCEVVVPLVGRQPHSEPSLSTARVRTGEQLHRPGGEWLYAKVYCAAARQDDVIRDHLPDLISLIGRAVSLDRWFYLRYADPEPHLRIRVKGESAALWSAGLAVLHDWSAGLSQRLVLDSYDPEQERYGGAEVLDAAERVFQADSDAAVAELDLTRGDEPGRTRLVTASAVDLLLTFGPAETIARWLAAWSNEPTQRAAFRSSRAEILELIDTRADRPGVAALPGCGSVLDAWARRRDSARGYVTRLEATDPAPAELERIALSFAHLHCNRVFGTDRRRESDVLALAGNAIRSKLEQDRHGADRRRN
ncbi:lantibiotic dehydratase [Asanoa ishikariensis]|uniref:Thiopeptide-type bacteriocin biosynthesis domain-containing protein n=1 Tax=Asanoa ishikariensis TaxID=137265 RepID=A0A1H3U7M6_9ACTN|nr:lantibiotic dehydratase [Asanoa ishikariensis]GIF64124.1 lantibiotic dehydratase [Asanoa ishikariensis]SDZ58466.1 thiopeptide-type bacteriocin biosynthesis domain-containing protein [Asanoa ishikariensis]